MFKRMMLMVVLILALAAPLTMAQDDLESVDPSGQTVVYWHEWDGAQLEAIQAIVDSFNTNNEWGITVELVAQGNTSGLANQMSAAITSGELPSLTGGVFASTAQSYYLDGVLVPLDAYYDSAAWGFSDDEKADLNQGLLDVNRIPGEGFDGQLLSWPIGLSANVLSVNLQMLEALGFDAAPTTLDEFRAVSCAAAEMTGPNGEDVQGFPIRTNMGDLESFIASQGGQIFDYETNTFSFTSDEAIAVLTFFQDLYNDGCAYVPDGPFVNTADFAFALNPMAAGSSSGVPFINGDIEASGSGITNWINTTMPWSEGNRTLQAFLRSIAVITSTPEEQLATWLFIKHMASPESQDVWTTKTFYQPYSTTGLNQLTQEFLDANPQFTAVRDVLLDPEVTIYSSPAVLGYNDVANNIVPNMMAEILTGGRDVMEAAAEAEEIANEAVADAMQ
jgi:multiple sugar transport system substrate-binding protein/sn-glycerol 3-phosphate transport system substrate-binding protein